MLKKAGMIVLIIAAGVIPVLPAFSLRPGDMSGGLPSHPGGKRPGNPPFESEGSSEPEISKRGLIKRVVVASADDGGGVRPEVAATDKMVFVVYHGNITRGKGSTFSVRIYDAGMKKEIASRDLVSASRQYGGPTDSRIASDGKSLYLFYETADMRKGKSYLWGERYRLDEKFERLAYTREPFATGSTMNVAREGDEKLDDPAPVIGSDSVFVITRYKTAFKKSGKTLYKVREFDGELKKIREFDLDLSDIADGGARQVSVIYHNGFFYMVLPTTTGEGKVEVDMATPSDIIMVKLSKEWKVVESKTLSAEPDDVETYVTGFKTDGERFYVTYNQVRFGEGVSSPLKIYDRNFKLLHKEKITALGKRKKGGGPSIEQGLRPSLEISGDRLFLGNNEGKNAVVYIYDKNRINITE